VMVVVVVVVVVVVGGDGVLLWPTLIADQTRVDQTSLTRPNRRHMSYY